MLPPPPPPQKKTFCKTCLRKKMVKKHRFLQKLPVFLTACLRCHKLAVLYDANDLFSLLASFLAGLPSALSRKRPKKGGAKRPAIHSTSDTIEKKCHIKKQDLKSTMLHFCLRFFLGQKLTEKKEEELSGNPALRRTQPPGKENKRCCISLHGRPAIQDYWTLRAVHDVPPQK